MTKPDLHASGNRLAGVVGLVALLALLAATGLSASARVFWLGEVAASFRWQIGWAVLVVPLALLLLRRPILAVAGLTLVLWNLWPELALYWGGDRMDPEGASFEVASVNLLWGNTHRSDLLAWIEEERPDVIAILEIDTAWREALMELRPAYPYQLVHPAEDADWHPGTWGLALISRHPLEATRAIPLPEREMPVLEARVKVAGASVLVRTAHASRPGKAWRNEARNAQLRLLATELEWDSRSILLGDLNTTSYSPAFADLLESSGLQDSRKGFGRLPTFRVTHVPVLDLSASLWIAIDHVLVGEELAVLARSTREVQGTDHRLAFARLAIR